MEIEKYIFTDKVKACLLAGALGDALGYEVEFDNWSTIQKEYGKRGITNLVTHGGKARVSDDTQMTLFTCEGMVLGFWRDARKGVGAELEEYIYQAYLCWLKTQGSSGDGIKSLWESGSKLLKVPEMNALRAPGNTCLSALGSGKMGTMMDPINNSKGCGGVMRSAPVGFMTGWGAPLIKGAASAAITHGHPGGWIPAGILSDIIYRIIFQETKQLENVFTDSIKAAREVWSDPEALKIYSMLFDAIELSHSDIPDVDAIHQIGGGWVGDEALAIALYSCLKHPDHVKDALICSVNHSGDSDSTGAITGNILGAYLGMKALPSDWVSKLELTEEISFMSQAVAKAQFYL